MMDLLARYKELVLLLTVVAWCFTWRTGRPAWWPWLGIQLCLALVVELFGKWLGDLGVANHLLYNSYLFTEFMLTVGLVLRSLPMRPRAIEYAAAVALIVFCGAFAWDLVSHGTWKVFATNALIVGGFMIGSLATLALFVLARTSSGTLYRLPVFWVLLSFLVYFLCIAPVFGLYNYLIDHNPALAVRIYVINDVLFVLRYVLVIIGLLILRRTQRAAQ